MSRLISCSFLDGFPARPSNSTHNTREVWTSWLKLSFVGLPKEAREARRCLNSRVTACLTAEWRFGEMTVPVLAGTGELG
jgi:hypothetical protein